jgi:HEAT repeat protein
MLWFALFLSNLWGRSPAGAIVVILIYLALFWPAWKNLYQQHQVQSHPEAIAKYLLSEHEEKRYLALATFPDQFTDRELIRFSRDDSPRIRVRSLFEAGRRGNARFVEVFAAGLKDPQLNVRTRACMALGGIRSDHAADLLEQAFRHDASWYVRMYAYQALGKLRPMARIIKTGQ